MGKFDFKRFNGFARKRLDDKLYSDLWNHDIFNECDMHSSAYFYIRDYFRKHNRGAVYVRCESRLLARNQTSSFTNGASPSMSWSSSFSPSLTPLMKVRSTMISTNLPNASSPIPQSDGVSST